MHLNLFLYHNDSDGRLLDHSILFVSRNFSLDVLFYSLHRTVMAQIRFLGSNDGALMLGRVTDTNVQTVGRRLANDLDQRGIEVVSLLQPK